jgi:hypothetical protein
MAKVIIRSHDKHKDHATGVEFAPTMVETGKQGKGDIPEQIYVGAAMVDKREHLEYFATHPAYEITAQTDTERKIIEKAIEKHQAECAERAKITPDLRGGNERLADAVAKLDAAASVLAAAATAQPAVETDKSDKK